MGLLTHKLVYTSARTLTGIEGLWVLPAGHVEANAQSITGEFVDTGERPAIKSLARERVLMMKDPDRIPGHGDKYCRFEKSGQSSS